MLIVLQKATKVHFHLDKVIKFKEFTIKFTDKTDKNIKKYI